MRVNSTLVILTLAFTTIAFSFCGSEAITEKGNNKEQNISLEDSAKHKFTNALINETSPYLLQHAHNPVNWHAWNAETLEKAKRENKLLLISIGYSACHWCHVMEHESFEDEEVARIMNEHFISIKIDREERPDIDQIYMNAVHLMNQRGGWPLNCFALPDGRPFFGGTYFPKSQWLQLLGKVAAEYKNNPPGI
ncbi:MAG TPA: thioredoxin domain-containing protein, partial [Flavobacteriales bacterium]|nr:thioredoxin domain-containing protein [Flavobacteriales bacterium]